MNQETEVILSKIIDLQEKTVKFLTEMNAQINALEIRMDRMETQNGKILTHVTNIDVKISHLDGKVQSASHSISETLKNTFDVPRKVFP